MAFSFISDLGKNWHAPKKPFRPAGGMTSYAKRVEERKHREAVKEHEKELKEEKEAERQVTKAFRLRTSNTDLICLILQAHIQAIKNRRAAKEEKERYDQMAEKMHHKRVERLKRREKRNKLLNS